MRKFSAAIAIAMLSSCVPMTPAYSQQQALPISCGPRKEVLKVLEEYAEASVGIGLNASGVVELFISEKGETFSVVLTLPNGQSCLVINGSEWENLKFVKPVNGQPS